VSPEEQELEEIGIVFSEGKTDVRNAIRLGNRVLYYVYKIQERMDELGRIAISRPPHRYINPHYVFTGRMSAANPQHNRDKPPTFYDLLPENAPSSLTGVPPVSVVVLPVAWRFLGWWRELSCAGTFTPAPRFARPCRQLARSDRIAVTGGHVAKWQGGGVRIALNLFFIVS
jgi:hypothetical protein